MGRVVGDAPQPGMLGTGEQNTSSRPACPPDFIERSGVVGNVFQNVVRSDRIEFIPEWNAPGVEDVRDNVRIAD